MPLGKVVNILLVEDDEVDVMAIRRAMKRSKISNPVHVAGDGLEALEQLRAVDETAIPRPFIILLDLNMPRMNGLEFLEELRQDEALQDSIVFVLTTSDSDRDRVAAYRKNIAGYVLKSNVGDQFIQLLSMLDSYWNVVVLP
jgi:CheY-like chemotaxis protein